MMGDDSMPDYTIKAKAPDGSTIWKAGPFRSEDEAKAYADGYVRNMGNEEGLKFEVKKE